ncbi:putative acetyltransferase [Pseudomonas sp. M47T1]|uniref:GNAT family acetyltransferase n=1 Tax=Pseudomonas sp. M47T1 TaxID=1179778 RepID=UPI0002607FD3|nr:putative acetyltransferase [Pseudomonas sp. M47T1]
MPTVLSYDDTHHREAVIALWRDVFDYPTAHNQPSLALERKLAVDQLLFVAMDGDTLTGTTMAGYDGHRGWLYSVAVHPHWQKHGIGAALVRHAEAALTALGCLKINLQITAGNDAVVGFYQRLGYVVEPRISMGKVISTNIPGNYRP